MMARMKTYTIYDGDQIETKEAMSYKKAVKSYQNNAKTKQIRVEWDARKGGTYEKLQDLPLGRSKKLGR
tara:strand:- start:76 stop:282 length:207 start_codon:yes stop_codon:yes gene_type:complete